MVPARPIPIRRTVQTGRLEGKSTSDLLALDPVRNLHPRDRRILVVDDLLVVLKKIRKRQHTTDSDLNIAQVILERFSLIVLDGG